MTTTKKRAPRPKQSDESPEPTPTELLAADAEPIEFPAGTPDLVPMMMLPRRQRADVLRGFGAFANRHRDESAEIEGTGEIGGSLMTAASITDMAADCEDMLKGAAKNADEFESWASEVDDSTLLTAAIAYMRTYQPGEAPRSSS